MALEGRAEDYLLESLRSHVFQGVREGDPDEVRAVGKVEDAKTGQLAENRCDANVCNFVRIHFQYLDLFAHLTDIYQQVVVDPLAQVDLHQALLQAEEQELYLLTARDRNRLVIRRVDLLPWQIQVVPSRTKVKALQQRHTGYAFDGRNVCSG